MSKEGGGGGVNRFQDDSFDHKMHIASNLIKMIKKLRTKIYRWSSIHHFLLSIFSVPTDMLHVGNKERNVTKALLWRLAQQLFFL